MTFEARYEGSCEECGDDICPGDLVAYVDDELVHADCADDARSAGLTIITDPGIAKPTNIGRPPRPEIKHPGNPAQTFL